MFKYLLFTTDNIVTHLHNVTTRTICSHKIYVYVDINILFHIICVYDIFLIICIFFFCLSIYRISDAMKKNNCL
jgi:hypothetical protein